jgi:hypothetical protein
MTTMLLLCDTLEMAEEQQVVSDLQGQVRVLVCDAGG